MIHLPSLLLTWLGATVLLSAIPRVQRQGLVARIQPYLPGGQLAAPPHVPWRDAFGSRAVALTEGLARLGGVVEPTARRLERAHVDLDATQLRARQLGRAGVAGGVAAVLASATSIPPAHGLAGIVGVTLLSLLVAEQQLIARGRDHQERITRELPIIEEQLAMLLGAGWSLGAALSRLATRSSGAVARDLERVVRRIRHGVEHSRALQEWADLVDVPGVHRLVRLLVLERHGGDLSRLIAEEARAARLELHRRTIEDLERRAQLVWVPVTVATLLPGVLFLAVPFLEAMRLFST